jgi:proteasome activator subunit 4
MDFDILGMRGIYHQTRVQELVQRFSGWRAERLPGSRAFQSTYDKLVLTYIFWAFLDKREQSGNHNMSLVIPNGARYQRDIRVRLYSAAYGTQRADICRFLTFMPYYSLNYFVLPKVFREVFTVAYLKFSSSVSDNDELLSRARMLLVRMCGVTPPRPLIGPILNAIFDTILKSPVRRSPSDL